MKNNTAQSLAKTALAAALILELGAGAHAATINVDNNSCTLADAITAANTNIAVANCAAGSGDDVIELPSASTIILTEALPAIVNSVTINANGSSITRDINAVSEFAIITGGDLGNLPQITIDQASISGGLNPENYGGGISLFAASLTLTNSVVSNNTGGGVSVTRGDNSSITASIISNNVTAAGPDASFYGGGIAVSGGNMLIENSSIANNQSNSASQLGGGLYLTSYAGVTTVNIINSTISGNSSTSNGGGVVLYSSPDSDLTVNVINTTIINNTSGSGGGGIFNDEGSLTLTASVISGNTANTVGNNIESVDGTVTSSNYNLFGFNNNAGLSGVTLGANDIIPSATNLSDIISPILADNGGSTPTHNLSENSPAIDAILPGNCSTANDQTGFIRGNDGNDDALNGCDMGAVEFRPALEDFIFKNGFEN
jgi:hypothetical protein